MSKFKLWLTLDGRTFFSFLSGAAIQGSEVTWMWPVCSNEKLSTPNMATQLECRIQYLDDRDPFANTNFPEPTRPPTYSFLLNVPIINQIGGVHRVLEAPHRVSHWKVLFGMSSDSLTIWTDDTLIEVRTIEGKHLTFKCGCCVWQWAFILRMFHIISCPQRTVYLWLYFFSCASLSPLRVYFRFVRGEVGPITLMERCAWICENAGAHR